MKQTQLDTTKPRDKILLAALKLFAEHGLASTSVRQIATAASVNVSAISYYFGDKHGLYKAAYTEPFGGSAQDIALFDQPNMPLEAALRGMFSGFIAPLKQGELAQQCIRLHMREMVEPTGLWSNEIENQIAPHQKAVLALLKRHLKLSTEDDDLHRLAMCIVGLGVHLLISRDVTEKLYPQLIQSDAALDTMLDRLVEFSQSMIATEAARRKQ